MPSVARKAGFIATATVIAASIHTPAFANKIINGVECDDNGNPIKTQPAQPSGGNTSSQQGQSQVANGGAGIGYGGAVKNSGNSDATGGTVKDSGNSSATGGSINGLNVGGGAGGQGGAGGAGGQGGAGGKSVSTSNGGTVAPVITASPTANGTVSPTITTNPTASTGPVSAVGGTVSGVQGGSATGGANDLTINGSRAAANGVILGSLGGDRLPDQYNLQPCSFTRTDTGFRANLGYSDLNQSVGLGVGLPSHSVGNTYGVPLDKNGKPILDKNGQPVFDCWKNFFDAQQKANVAVAKINADGSLDVNRIMVKGQVAVELIKTGDQGARNVILKDYFPDSYGEAAKASQAPAAPVVQEKKSKPKNPPVPCELEDKTIKVCKRPSSGKAASSVLAPK